MRAIACVLLLLVTACTRPAPPVSFALTNGEKITLADLRGRVVWLEFWSLSCAPCIQEMPAMRNLYAQVNPRDVAVIAIAMTWDPPAPVAEFVTREKLSWPVAFDLDSKVANAFNVPAVPYRVLIGRDGAIIHREAGRLDAARWRARITSLLP